MKEWIRPRPLRAGDRVRVVAPCGSFDRPRFDAGVELLRASGLVVEFDEGLFARHRYLAGDDGRRGAELEAALADPGVAAIWVARGGYGATRILNAVGLDAVRVRVPWLVGFSDVTALHARFACARVASVHGPNVTTVGTWSEDARAMLWRLLFSPGPESLSGRWFAGDRSVAGPLVGGNLTVLTALAGTPHMPSFDGCVVLLEDVGEKPYRLDRSLIQLRDAGVFAGVAGFVVGQLTDCDDTAANGVPARTVVCELLGDLGVPVVADVAVGHEPSSYPVLLGGVAELSRDGRVRVSPPRMTP